MTPELVAHRGYRLHYPENTLVAVEAAIRAGAKYVEIDVQLSRDGIPMLFHDEDLLRICGVKGAVREYTAEQLKQMRAAEYARFGYRYARNRMATLRELAQLLRRHPDVTVFVELKTESLAYFGIAKTLAAVRPALTDIEDRAVLISFSLDAILAARREGWRALGVVLERWRDRRLSIVREIAPQYLFCDVEQLPRFGRLRAGTAKIVIYEVDDPDIARRLARRGANFVETFAFGELNRALVT